MWQVYFVVILCFDGYNWQKLDAIYTWLKGITFMWKTQKVTYCDQLYFSLSFLLPIVLDNTNYYECFSVIHKGMMYTCGCSIMWISQVTKYTGTNVTGRVKALLKSVPEWKKMLDCSGISPITLHVHSLQLGVQVYRSVYSVTTSREGFSFGLNCATIYLTGLWVMSALLTMHCT